MGVPNIRALNVNAGRSLLRACDTVPAGTTSKSLGVRNRWPLSKQAYGQLKGARASYAGLVSRTGSITIPFAAGYA
jgi:hypothetical protein